MQRRGVQALRELQQLLRRRPQSRCRIDDDGKKRDQPDEGELGFETGAEPNQDHRRQRHFRHRLERNEQRIEHQIERPRVRDRDRERKPDEHRQHESVERFPERDPAFAEQQIAADDQGAQHLVRRGQHDGGNVEEPAGKDPGGDDQEDAGERIEDLGKDAQSHWRPAPCAACAGASSAVGATTPSASLAIRSAAVKAGVKRTFWLRG